MNLWIYTNFYISWWSWIIWIFLIKIIDKVHIFLRENSCFATGFLVFENLAIIFKYCCDSEKCISLHSKLKLTQHSRWNIKVFYEYSLDFYRAFCFGSFMFNQHHMRSRIHFIDFQVSWNIFWKHIKDTSSINKTNICINI